MLLPVINKSASFGKKPHIKKGYYPAKLISVMPYADSEGNLKEGTYGRQLIFEFEIHEQDKKGTPMMYLATEEATEKIPVVIPKFVYHEYLVKNPKPGEDRFSSAITPKSAITKILTALGWEFGGEAVDPEKLVGKFVEVNINDYQAKDGDEFYTASTAADIQMLVEDTVESADAKPVEEKPVEPKVLPDGPEAEELEAKKVELKELLDQDLLTQQGYDTSVEQIDAKLAALK